MMLLKLLTHCESLRSGATVIALRGGGELAPRFRALGVPVLELGMHPGLGSLTGIIPIIKRLRALRPQVVSTWMYHADLMGGIAARISSIPAVWGIRGLDLDPARTKRSTRTVVRACAALSRYVPRTIVCCSERARQIHVSLGYDERKFRVIPNGFDLALFRPDPAARASVRAELGIPFDAPLVGLVGRDDPQKNHAGFFVAAARIAGTRPDVHFLLAGKDVTPQNERIVSAMRDVNLPENRVHLLGSRQDVPRLMAALDVLVLSSYGEAFPNVLGEAMACEIPCVVTDVGDSAEIVGDTGAVVAPSDMHALADEVLRLLALKPEARRARGRAARRRVQERYDIARVAKQYEEVLIDAAGQPPR